MEVSSAYGYDVCSNPEYPNPAESEDESSGSTVDSNEFEDCEMMGDNVESDLEADDEATSFRSECSGKSECNQTVFIIDLFRFIFVL